MKHSLFILLLALIAPSLALAQEIPQSEITRRDSADQAEQQIAQVNRDFDEAERKRDFAAIERMLADDFIWTTFAGTVFDRPGTINHLRSGDSKYDLYQSDDVRIRIYGDAAVTTGRLIRRGRNSKGDLSGEFRYTRVYLKQTGNWRVAAYQLTSIAPAKNTSLHDPRNLVWQISFVEETWSNGRGRIPNRQDSFSYQ